MGVPSYSQASPSRPGRVFLFYGSSSVLAGTPDVILEGVHNADTFGTSVAQAGDVNGDGYDDIIVGSVTYDNTETDEGRLYLYYGSASGLVTTPVWTYESDQANAWLAVSSCRPGMSTAMGMLISSPTHPVMITARQMKGLCGFFMVLPAAQVLRPIGQLKATRRTAS